MSDEQPARFLDDLLPGRGTTQLDPSALTRAMTQVGKARSRFVRDRGNMPGPSSVIAGRVEWAVADELAKACYGCDFATLIGRHWWPDAKPPRAVTKIVQERDGFEVGL